MVPVFKVFAGGPLGDGRQWFSWVHADDAVAIIVRLLSDGAISGAVNVAAPRPVRFAEFCTALGAVMGRPSWLPVPEFAVQARTLIPIPILIPILILIPTPAPALTLSLRRRRCWGRAPRACWKASMSSASASRARGTTGSTAPSRRLCSASTGDRYAVAVGCAPAGLRSKYASS